LFGYSVNWELAVIPVQVTMPGLSMTKNYDTKYEPAKETKSSPK